MVVLGFGGFVIRLLGSFDTNGICRWPKHGLFLSTNMGAVIDGKGRMVYFLGGVIVASHCAVVEEILVKMGF